MPNRPVFTPTSPRGKEPSDPADAVPADATVELLRRLKSGDDKALDVLLRRSIPALQRWAHGRLPQSARGMVETADLVQDSVLATVRRLAAFEARHQGALQAYFKQAVMNRIRDLVRQTQRRPMQAELPEHLVDQRASPLEQAIGSDNMARFEAALQRLRPVDREAIIGRLEMQQSYDELAIVLKKPNRDAARVAVCRAMKRLADELRKTPKP